MTDIFLIKKGKRLTVRHKIGHQVPDFTGENELIRIFGSEFFCATAHVAIS
jgi:hypothetical protein